MARFNLTTIRPKGFVHASAFAEVKDSLAWCLSALGHEVQSTENSFSQGEATNIIFGAELLPPTQQVPPNLIIYNLEQPTHPSMPNVRLLAGRWKLKVWDYSPRNIRDWQTAGIAALHLPIGYTPNLTRIPKAATQDIDVAFFGWMTQRRVKLLGDLRRAGLKVAANDNCYGGARDEILSRTKVCLNVHHDGRDMFEIVRVSYLLANGKCVISEASSDMEEYIRPLNGALEWHPYEGLVGSTIYLVEHASRRSIYEDESLLQMRSTGMNYTQAVERVLDTAPTTKELQTASQPYWRGAIQDRFNRACKDGDMVDFAPWLMEHARGNILEIGTRDGASTSAFLLGLEKNGPPGHLTSLDIEDCSQLWRHPQWTFHRSNSLTAQFPDATFDIILIDGAHEQAAYRGDLYNAWHWVKPGGMILTHDCKPERGHEFYAVGIREELDKFRALHPEAKFEMLPGKYGMGVLYKPAAEGAGA